MVVVLLCDRSVVGVVAWLVVVAIVVVVMVAWLAPWLRGAMLVVEMVVEICLVQNNDRKRKNLPQRITARLTRRIPLNNGGEIYLNINLAA